MGSDKDTNMYEGSGILTYSKSSFSFQELLLPDLKDLPHSFFHHLNKDKITTLSSSYVYISGEVGGAKLVEWNLQPIKERHQLIPGPDCGLDGTENTFSTCTRAKLRRAR